MNIKGSNVIIDIDNKNINKVIRKTKKILRLCDSNNYKLKINYIEDIKDEDKLFWIKNIEKVVNIKDIEKRYSFIYDVICDYIDKKYIDCNYCDFKDDVCVYFRYHKDYNHKNGCCYSDKRGGLCKNLVNRTCKIKSISCKLYSCEYLREKGINFRMKDFPLIKYFFNIKQKYYIKYSFFKPKTYVIYKLIESKK